MFRGNSSESLRKVGTLRPNLCGLYDIVGLSKEWCEDSTTEFDNGVWKVARGAGVRDGSIEYPDREIGGRLIKQSGRPNYFIESTSAQPYAREVLGTTKNDRISVLTSPLDLFERGDASALKKQLTAVLKHQQWKASATERA